MKREILFRGFCPNESGDETIILDEEEIMGDWHYWNCFDGINRLNAGFMVTDTVGQWTGLTDKNGKKIFEHDRIKYKCGDIAEVIFTEYGAFVGETESLSHENIGGVLTEVIGTIFDKEADNG